MLRLHLPPNFAAAAGRDAIPLRLDFDHAAAPDPALFPALALLQRWCRTPTPPKFLQLSRAQLRELAAALGDRPVFVEDGRAVPFRHAALLAGPAAASTASPVASSPGRPAPAAPAAPGLVVDGSEHFLSLQLPSRDHPRYADALALVKENGFVLEPSNRRWWLRDRHRVLNFLGAHLERLRTVFAADFAPNFTARTAHLRPAEIDTVVDDAGREFAVTLALRAGSAPDAEIRTALATGRSYLEDGGKIFLLDPVRLEKLAAAQRALAGDPAAGVSARRTQRLPSARAVEAGEILETLSPGFAAPAAWKARSGALRNLSTLAPAPLPPALAAQLRPYQQLGVAWLWHLRNHELGGVLADEMGLGKTLQALALLVAVHAPASPASGVRPPPGPRRTSLVVAPASLLENWRREALRFAPQLRTFVHHGDRRLAAPADFAAHDLVVTSYGTLVRDQLLFADVPFSLAVADEAQHIKNRRSRPAAALRALDAHARFLLTGTPLENSLDDLRSLFEFLLPGFLRPVPPGLRGDERTWHDERLRAQTAPYILRRTKRAVAPELPAKLEHIVWCELVPEQARLYREMQERGERELLDLESAGAGEQKLKFTALAQLLRLRQICCDPRLLAGRTGPAGDDADGADAPDADRGTDAPDSASAALVADSPADSAAAEAESAKSAAFAELLEEALDDGHRLLVFSQFTSLLALLRADLAARDIACCYLDGSMTARARQAEVDRFQASTEIPVFLLSLKAGGTGLNLTGADTVVHYDPWWNPAAEAQATDRAHRIGQTRVVTSYKLIAAGTVEEKVLALQDEKRALLADVFAASDAAAAKLSLADLKSLLR